MESLAATRAREATFAKVSFSSSPQSTLATLGRPEPAAIPPHSRGPRVLAVRRPCRP